MDLLKDTFGDRLISRFGPVNWPPRSCDLTPLDYFLWGYVKSLVYADKPQTLDHLEDNIRRVFTHMRPQMLEKVIENLTSRLDYIRASRGSHMPEILFEIQHRTARLQWCREHHNWTEQDWACVLFSDESRFSLSSDCRRQLIWRESGTAYRPENIQEKDRYPTCSIMVWAGIMINGRTRLHVVANGTMTGQRYIDEVLLPHDCLDSEGIQRLVWPVCSPDLNPIENVWDTLGRQVAGRNYPPTNKNTLIRALTEEWDKLPQQLLDNVVQLMVRRVECCITLHGGHIPY
ncbi:transposable element Tcb2 transposase [Trichonephila clavipes]|nr:transposable element Tcb2 transposase [Trichonephila clavipes]